jgi:hypothetical protein
MAEDTLDLSIKVRGIDLDVAYLDKLEIIESMQFLVPSIELSFYDSEDQILQEAQVVDTVPVEVRVNGTSYEFVCSTYDVSTQNDVKYIVLKGLLSSILGLANRIYYRSWSNKTASQVIEDMLEYDDSIIESDKNTQNWIQPGWTNAQMVRYLAHRAVSRSHRIGGYVYSYTKSNMLIFSSIDNLIEQSPTYKFSDEYDENDVTNYVIGYKGVNNAMSTMVTGGLGRTVDYYNFATGTPVSYTVTPQNVSHLSMSEAMPYSASDLNELNREVYGGYYHSSNQSLHNFQGLAESEVVMRLISNQKIKVAVYGNTDITIGNVFSLYLNKREEDSKVRDTSLSGKWLTQTVTHSIGVGSFVSVLMGCREGLNRKDHEVSYTSNPWRVT